MFNSGKELYSNLKEGNFKKALLTLGGNAIDQFLTPLRAIGMKVAPSYAMPATDIPIALYNRFARKYSGDNNYTAIKGHSYDRSDYSAPVWEEAQRAAKIKQYFPNGIKYYLDARIKNQVDDNLDYGSSKLLLHPFNPMAAYAWTIGNLGNEQDINGVPTIIDYYNNSNRKTAHYNNKANKSITDMMRGTAGVLTSHDDEPVEG